MTWPYRVLSVGPVAFELDEPPHIQPVDHEQRKGYEHQSEYHGESDYGVDRSTIDGGLGLRGRNERRIRRGKSVGRRGIGRLERRLTSIQLLRRGKTWRHAALQGVSLRWFCGLWRQWIRCALLM